MFYTTDSMKNTLAIKILRGSLFLVIALVASYMPRLLGLPASTQDKANVATILALFMQGVIWTNIIISHYLHRYVQGHAADGASIMTYSALAVVARLMIWVIIGGVAVSYVQITVRELLMGLGICCVAVVHA